MNNTTDKEFMTLLQEFVIGFLNDARRQGFAIILLLLMSCGLGSTTVYFFFEMSKVQKDLLVCAKEDASKAAVIARLEADIEFLKDAIGEQHRQPSGLKKRK